MSYTVIIIKVIIDNRPTRIDMKTLLWLRRPNDGRQECVVKNGSNGRHTSEQDPG